MNLQKEIENIISVYNKEYQGENIKSIMSIDINWDLISAHQALSENFIREFQNKVNWYFISIYQNLSETFIREFKDKVHWNKIYEHQKLSPEFRIESTLWH